MALPEMARKYLASHSTDITIAVVGASKNPHKYGNIIVRNLSNQGFDVIPVNPRETTIAGLTVASEVSDIDRHVHIVNVVTPPEVSLDLVDSLDPEEFDVIWFQEGSFDGEVVQKARERFENVVAGPCIMVEAGRA